MTESDDRQVRENHQRSVVATRRLAKVDEQIVDKRHRADFDPPGAKGPLVWYLVGVEPLEIRMTENLIDDCFAAAKSLGARFFIMRRKPYAGCDEGWGVFDVRNPDPDNGYLPLMMQNNHKARPVRIFDTETLDAPVMWAIAIGGLR